MIKDIIEYVDIPDMKALLGHLFDKYRGEKSRKFGNCPIEAYQLGPSYANPGFIEEFKPITDILDRVSVSDPLVSGFDYFTNPKHGLPYHIDCPNNLKAYNLIIPVFGTVTCDFWEGDYNELEYKGYGSTHYKMFKDSYDTKNLIKMGSILIDKPVLIDTDYIHNVIPVDVPRLAWLTRFSDLDKEYTFKEFKSIVEEKLSWLPCVSEHLIGCYYKPYPKEFLKDQFSSEILFAVEIDYGNVGYIPEHTDTRSDRNKYPNAVSYIIPQQGDMTIHSDGNSTKIEVGSIYMLDIYNKPHSATVLDGTKCIHVVTRNPNEKTFT